VVRFGLFLCIVFSIAIHLGLYFLLPGISPPPIPAEEYTEVELRELPSPLPPPEPAKEEVAERLPPPEPPKEEQGLTPEPEPPVVAEVAPPTPIADAEISALLDEGVVSLGLSLRPPAIDIDVPAVKPPVLEPEIAVSEGPSSTVEALFEKLGGSVVPAGSFEEGALPLTFSQLEKLEREPEVGIKLDSLLAAELAPGHEVPTVDVAAEVVSADVQISGPASGRGSPIYWPPSPEVAVASETLIVLKFWVLPDGRVGQVLPVRIDDAALEAEGIKFVSALRFRQLESFEKQEKQWGLISLVFKPQ